MGSTSTNRGQLVDAVADLASALETRLDSYDPSELPGQSSQVASKVFSDLESNISNLYRLLEYPRKAPLSWPDGATEPGTEFWRRIMAMTSCTGKRASILAIFLLAGVDFLVDTWDVLLQHLGMWPDKAPAENDHLQDVNLPIPVDRLEKIFDIEHAEVFDEGQHRFCQLDPEKLKPDFDQARDALIALFYEKAVVKCEVRNERGEREKSSEYNWSPETELRKIFNDHEAELKTLYVASKHADREAQGEELPTHPRQLRKMYDEQQMEASHFLQSLQSCWKIVAVLIKIKINPRSCTWRKFRHACACGTSQLPSTLPIPFADLTFVEEASGWRDDFYAGQFVFCPIELRRNEMRRFEDYDQVRLPLLSQHWLGSGASGQVYKVEVAPGYLDKDEKRELAMKVLDRNARYSYMEWYSAHKLKDHLFKPKGIIMPLASVRTKTKIYLFMELAAGDLHRFMREMPGPKDFSERRARISHISSIARSIQHLHLDLWEGTGGRREALIHGDIKAGNILYIPKNKSGDDSKSPLKISDFGVSAFHYAPKDPGDESARDRYSTARLARSCPNFPPEAEETGKVNAMVDIWGFGTVFVDYLAWVSGGVDALESFQNARRGPYDSDDKHLYYSTNDAGEKTRKAEIDTWFDDLIHRTEQKDEKDLYRACWNLIKDLLLVCDPNRRGNIEDVTRAFSRILKDNHYSKEWTTSPTKQDSSDRRDPLVPTSTRSSTETSNQTKVEGTSIETRSWRNKHFQKAIKKHDADKKIRFSQAGDDIHVDDDYKQTAFHFAVRDKGEVFLRHLLKHHGQSVKQTDNQDATALHVCARLNTPSAVKKAKLILKKDRSMLEMKDANGDTALDCAHKHPAPRRDMIELLKECSRLR